MRPTVWNPFKEIKTLRDQMNNFLDETFHSPEGIELQPSVDIYEKGEEIVVKVNIPGINPEEVEIMVSEDTLIIQGELTDEKEIEEEGYHKVERQTGKFKRTISLPFRVKRKEAKASSEHGVLEIRMPKTEEEIEKITRLEIEN
ncbi:Hsp20/alpha crystallin family protein [Sporohalobacter salinus]|uniref:Hsp20/alpha crystallin family protein n=1 Tax=Sporohalobacter salinus TaxID=1494606 RepID=UPI0019601EDF|nr:Hsp20/alpha crystallin family protein [Sporohalobacter salinus]MBM7624020.1 HSP20 family protein [Sporohalobacter salinus]